MDATNFVMEQGDDLPIKITYKEGTLGSEVALNLTTGYSVRMDIVSETGTRLATFNSADLPAPENDTTKEVTLGNGTNNIVINVPRALTLPSGAIGGELASNKSVFKYDMFLRITSTDKQRKILTGTITVNPTVTRWS